MQGHGDDWEHITINFVKDAEGEYVQDSVTWLSCTIVLFKSIRLFLVKVPTQWLVHPAKCWGEPQCLRWKGWILSLFLSFFLSNQSHRFQIAHGSYDNWWKILKSYFRSFPLVRWPWVCLGFWLLCGRMRILGRLQVSHCRQHFYLRVKSSMGSWSQPVNPDHANYCFFLLHFYQYMLGFCFKLKLLFRNDETGIHWLPESILHVSEVTDDEVTCENGYSSYMYINLIAYFHHKKLLNDQFIPGEPREQL